MLLEVDQEFYNSEARVNEKTNTLTLLGQGTSS